jgi:hypothetical protein
VRLAERLEAGLGGLAAGFSGGLFGVGGGVVLVPLLTRRFHCSQHQAHGTSLAVIGSTALAAVVVYGWLGHVAWRTAAVVALASAVTARFGARWAARTSSVALTRAFAVFLAIVAIRLLMRVPEPKAIELDPAWVAVALDLGLGAAVGLLSGFLGVGGGVLAVPAFTLGLGMSQQAAQGTSLAVILVSGPAGALEHARHGNVVWGLVPMLAVGALLGAPLASWLAHLMPHETLTRGFALFLLANAVHSWLRPPPPKV